jgi:hypothetical protein
VTLVDGASRTATVVEVRAHDEPGLLWRIGRALGECGLNVRAARVETLGAEAVDVFYVTDSTGGLLSDPDARRRVVAAVLSALSSDLSIQNVPGLLLRVRVRRPLRGRTARPPIPPGPGSLEACLRRSPTG